jgi:hypothetical protein
MVFFWGEFSLLHTLTTLKKSISMFEWVVDQKDHEVGELCVWYKLDVNQSIFLGKLIEVHVHQGFHPRISHICSCPSQTFRCDAQGSKQFFLPIQQLTNCQILSRTWHDPA